MMEEERREKEGEGRRESKLYLPHAHVQCRYACRAVAARAQSCARGGTRTELRAPLPQLSIKRSDCNQLQKRHQFLESDRYFVI